MSILQDKVAIIIGASSGIGRATAMLFAAQGAAIVLNARNEAGLVPVAQAIKELGGEAHYVAGDASQAETHEKLIAVAQNEFGRLDIAFNNAGTVGPIGPMTEASLDDWNKVIAGNLTSAFLGAKSQIPFMLKSGGGSIIFTSTFVGTSVGIPGMSLYGAAKAGLMGLVKGITADYGAQGIRANALLPGGVDTPMAGSDAQKEWAAGLHAMKRIAQPEEIAQAALFLAGPMASFVSGSALYADGGNSAVK
ncbi:SDR family oxidoreductase [Brucella pseudogrignonensis]|uniref:SDR family oxidoreductase n=1 Tax=Brucella pseudogrignonensis TaxID=419475 RepID=UPI000CFB665C|nr:SDR family oxidoreductase [Brucella pseudogrignonensis]MQP39140.1 SDR family oxidoreductase [Ochrobactrum sp. MYb237]PQZ43731.1 glucose dehydrogenase [Brucella pseudogrignonensis]PRA43478.1 glucose dehydrogenase [Brucella pseudogrignonensis]PRA72053.1 glucose dehydrogenase [Brucella pseudogrignonensis]